MKRLLYVLFFVLLVIYLGIKTQWFTFIGRDRVQDGFTWIVWFAIGCLLLLILGWDWIQKKEKQEG